MPYTSPEETTVPSNVLSPNIITVLLAARVKTEEHSTETHLTKTGFQRRNLSKRANMLTSACGKVKSMPYTDL